MARSPKKCPLCKDRPIKKRGLCDGCYMAARRRIKAGEATDEQLVQLQILKPRKRPGGPPSVGGRLIDKAIGK